MTENNNNDNIIEENESKGDVKGQIKDWRARHSVISVIICLFLLGSLVSLPGCKDKSEAADGNNANSAAAEEMPAQKDAADSSNANSAAAEEMPAQKDAAAAAMQIAPTTKGGRLTDFSGVSIAFSMRLVLLKEVLERYTRD